MPPLKYRYYRLDGAKLIHDSRWLPANGDDEALSTVSRLHPTSRCEVWLGNRLIGTTPSGFKGGSPEALGA